MAELQVSRKNVATLLSLSDKGYTNKTYIIPEYQRPYRWENNECDTLWMDIVNFYTALKEPNAPQEYFLGTIVTCTDSANTNDIDIIDGQQRITSLLLLLRAFYKQLEMMHQNTPTDKNVNGLINQINPCIWRIKNRMSGEVEDFTDLKIISKVALDKDNDDFKTILSSGTELTTSSNYSKNYKFFLDKCKEFAQCYPMDWKELCQCILDRCIVLPIECEDLNSALTIFGTLNNRGLPLSDSDIFKAELYKLKTSAKEKSDFIEEWKTLEEITDDGGFSINDVFRFYTHVIRAKNDVTENEKGLRRFYSGDDFKFKEFKEELFFENIVSLALFWNSVNINATKYDEDNEFCTLNATKYVQCLLTYPNDYWRCIVTVYYFKHKDDADFKEGFEDFLRRLTAYMYVLFVIKPMVNEVKKPTYKFCVDVYKTGNAIFQYGIPEDFAQRIDFASQGLSKIVKPMILLHTYLYNPNQPLITGKIEIEHILPKKWKEANYYGWERNDAKVLLESIGNKIPFEKRLNIQAGNGYFGEKKSKYIKSPIVEVQDLSKHTSNDWLKEDIENRRNQLCDRLIKFFKENLTSTNEPEQVEELFNVSKGKEQITILRTISNGKITYKMNSTRQVSAEKLSMSQIISGNIPVEQSTITYNSLPEAIAHLDKSILIGADNIKVTDDVKDEMLNW